MIAVEIRKELFASNLKVIDEIINQLKQNIEDAQNYLNDEKDSDEYNLNTVMGTLMEMPRKLKQIGDIQNVLESIHTMK